MSISKLDLLLVAVAEVQSQEMEEKERKSKELESHLKADNLPQDKLPAPFDQVQGRPLPSHTPPPS